MSTENQRVFYLDLLRVVAIFGVILVHVFCKEYYTASIASFNWYVAVVGDSLLHRNVPLFIMISGALFLRPEKEITIRKILLKNIPRLLLAYVFWTLTYGIVFTSYRLYKGEDFSIYHLLVPHFHLWFLPLMMGVYLLIPLLRKISNEKRLLKYTLCLWVIYVTVSFINPDFIIFKQIFYLFNMNNIVGYAGYFLLGYYLSNKVFSKKQHLVIYIAGILALLLTITGNLYLSISTGQSSGRFLFEMSPFNIITASAIFVLVKQISPKVHTITRRFVEYVRNDLFGIYLTHALWLFVLNQSKFRNLGNHLLTLPIIAIFIFFLSLFTTKLIKMIPGLKKVVE